MTEGDTLVTILYALVGSSGALAVTIFAWGFVEYVTKIGLPAEQRNRGIAIMEWGVRIILTAIFLILVLKFVEEWVG